MYVRSAVAVERIYAAKGRDPQKPLPICVADPSDVAQYADVRHLPPGLLEALLPGPVTLVLPYGEFRWLYLTVSEPCHDRQCCFWYCCVK